MNKCIKIGVVGILLYGNHTFFGMENPNTKEKIRFGKDQRPFVLKKINNLTNKNFVLVDAENRVLDTIPAFQSSMPDLGLSFKKRFFKDSAVKIKKTEYVYLIEKNLFNLKDAAAEKVGFRAIEKYERGERKSIEAYLIGLENRTEKATTLHSWRDDERIPSIYSFEINLKGQDLTKSWINIEKKDADGKGMIWNENRNRPRYFRFRER